MNRSEFIAAMEAQLIRLPKADRDDILNDYETHFVNGIAEGKTEEEVSAQLGDPVELAAVYLENLPEGSKGNPYIPQEVYEDNSTNIPPQPENTWQSAGYYGAEQTANTSGNGYAAQGAYYPGSEQNAYTSGAGYTGQNTYSADPENAWRSSAGASAQPTDAAAQDKAYSAGGIVAVVLLSIFVAVPVLWTIAGAILGAFGVTLGCFIGGLFLVVGGIACMGMSTLAAVGMILLGVALAAFAMLALFVGILGVKGTIWLVKWYIDACKKMIGGNI